MVLRFHSEEDPGAKLLLHHLTIILILIIISGAQPSYVKLCLFLHPESNYPKASLKGHGCRQTGKIKKEVTRH